MKTAGIIVEYNPFHNGHHWHAKETRRLCEADAVVAVMSGQFVQRGEAAFFDKWTRAEMAVHSGVDLVLELPVAYALRSAQFFAAGAVRLLGALGAVDFLCFGAENSDLTTLQKAATDIEKLETMRLFQEKMKSGHSYAKALGDALSGDELGNVLAQPNNILGIEYLRALEFFAPEIKAMPILRKTAAYHDIALHGEMASATAIRQAICDGRDYFAAVPEAVLRLIKRQCALGKGPVLQERFADFILFLLRQKTSAQLQGHLFGSADGLENRLKEAALSACDWESLTASLLTRRYTRGRLQRALLWIMLGIESELLAQADHYGPQYARILAFNDIGRKVLKRLRNTATIPFVDNPSVILKKTAQKYEQERLLEKMLLLDATATDAYAMGMPEKKWHTGGSDFKHSPVYLRNGYSLLE